MFVEKITLKYFLSDKVILIVIYNGDDWEIGSMFTKNRGAYSEDMDGIKVPLAVLVIYKDGEK